MATTLKHPGTGTVRVVPTGWSWSLFLGAGFLGLPLFFRGLAFWGGLMMTVWAARLAISHLGLSEADANSLEWLHTFLVSGLSLYLGFRGNALSANHYIACGYEPVGSSGGTASMDERIAAQLWEQ